MFNLISDSIISSTGRWLTDWTQTSTDPTAGSLRGTVMMSTPLPNCSGRHLRTWELNKSQLNTGKQKWWLGLCLTAILTQTGDTHKHTIQKPFSFINLYLKQRGLCWAAEEVCRGGHIWGVWRQGVRAGGGSQHRGVQQHAGGGLQVGQLKWVSYLHLHFGDVSPPIHFLCKA